MCRGYTFLQIFIQKCPHELICVNCTGAKTGLQSEQIIYILCPLIFLGSSSLS